jgi:AAA domain
MSANKAPEPAVLSLAQLLEQQPATNAAGWLEPGLLPPQGILFVGGEPRVGKGLFVANLALLLASGKERAGFSAPAARRVLVCQFELPTRSLFPGWRGCGVRWEPLPIKTCWGTRGRWGIY